MSDVFSRNHQSRFRKWRPAQQKGDAGQERGVVLYFRLAQEQQGAEPRKPVRYLELPYSPTLYRRNTAST
jgi:hypothetical protein